MTVDSNRSSGPTSRRTDTDDPRRARQQAFKILFQADVREQTPAEILARLDHDPAARTILVDDDTDQTAAQVDDFTRMLVEGVTDGLSTIDALIEQFARRWKVSRMPAVDRTVLRLATFELLHQDTPPAVILDEAIGLAKSLSTDNSGPYVNGVLESIRKHVTSAEYLDAKAAADAARVAAAAAAADVHDAPATAPPAGDQPKVADDPEIDDGPGR